MQQHHFIVFTLLLIRKVMQPKVSIIVPCWGVEKYLDQCVESLINQTLKDIEIVLVDDESPDRVPEMCDEWAKKDERIKVVHKKNAGLGMACNSGLDVATGEYVAFCDSDDFVNSNAYQILYEKAKSIKADVVYTSFKYVDINGHLLPHRSINYEERIINTLSDIQEVMKGMIASEPSSESERTYQASAKVALYKREIIVREGIRFVSERVIPSEDLVFNLDYLSHCRVVVTLPLKYYNYRTNPLSISHVVKKNAFDISKQLYTYLMQKISDLGLGEDGTYRVQRMIIGTTRSYVSRVIRSSLSKEEKEDLIKNISKDSIWIDVKRHYPVNIMPLKHRAYFEATMHKCMIILRIMTKYMR